MRSKALALYTVAVPISIGLAYWLTFIVFEATDGLPWKRMPDWTILAINVVPPMSAGVLTSLAAAWLAHQRGWYSPTLRAHATRLALAYALSLTITAVIIANQSNSDFGLWSQVIEWPLAALVGVAVVDAVITLIGGRRRAAT
jgi:hypothetical protein